MDPPFVYQLCHLGLVNECQDQSHFSTLDWIILGLSVLKKVIEL